MNVKADGKSWDLATCPFFRASLSFFGVACSVFSAMENDHPFERTDDIITQASHFMQTQDGLNKILCILIEINLLSEIRDLKLD